MITTSPETCTSPAADWGATLSSYSTYLEAMPSTSEDTKAERIRAKQRLLNNTWYRMGWFGLLHQDAHETAGKLYVHLSETRSRQQRKVAAATIEDFRQWYASR